MSDENLDLVTKKPTAGLNGEDVARRAALVTSVNRLGLGIRAENLLRRIDIGTVGELIQMTRAELLREPNFGLKSLKELEEALDSMGLKLKDVR